MPQKTIQLIFFVVFAIGLSAVLFFIFKSYLSVIFISGILAVSFYSFYEKLVDKFKGNKNLAAFATTLSILIFIIIPVILVFVFLLKEAVDLYNSIAFDNGSQNFIFQINVLAQKFSQLFLSEAVNPQINLGSYARGVLDWIIGHFNSVFVAVFGGILNFILMLISLYYLFIFGEKIKGSLVSWSPLPDKYDEEFIQTLKSSMDAVLRGRILVSVVQGVFIGVGFVVFGVGSPVLWGFIGTIASLIPILGTSIITVPAIAYLFLSGSIAAGIGLLVWSALAVGLIDNFISVLFLKGKIRVHPLIVLFSILGGIEVFGAIGFLVGPVVVSAIVALMKISPFIMSYKSEQ